MDRLEAASSCLVVVDVQERLLPAMPEARRGLVLANVERLLEGARILGVSVLATEQYPKGLGPTVPGIRSKLESVGASPIEKVTFDACGEPAFLRALAATSARSVIVTGVETHVCVFQTARELVRLGYATYVVADAVASRSEESRSAGLSLIERAGAIVTVTETCLFDWTKRAGTDEFRAISKLVKG